MTKTRQLSNEAAQLQGVAKRLAADMIATLGFDPSVDEARSSEFRRRVHFLERAVVFELFMTSGGSEALCDEAIDHEMFDDEGDQPAWWEWLLASAKTQAWHCSRPAIDRHRQLARMACNGIPFAGESFSAADVDAAIALVDEVHPTMPDDGWPILVPVDARLFLIERRGSACSIYH